MTETSEDTTDLEPTEENVFRLLCKNLHQACTLARILCTMRAKHDPDGFGSGMCHNQVLMAVHEAIEATCRDHAASTLLVADAGE